MQKNNDDALTERLTMMSVGEFMALGTDGVAYIKPMGIVDDAPTYAVHAADGSHIASGPDIALLRAIAGQQNLVSVMQQ